MEHRKIICYSAFIICHFFQSPKLPVPGIIFLKNDIRTYRTDLVILLNILLLVSQHTVALHSARHSRGLIPITGTNCMHVQGFSVFLFSLGFMTLWLSK